MLFPEGTDSDGTRVLPFHSSFLEAGVRTGSRVVPVAIRYGAPGVPHQEEVIYWKDRRFLPHLIKLLGVDGLTEFVRFGVGIPAGNNRKQLTQRVHQIVAVMVRAK